MTEARKVFSWWSWDEVAEEALRLRAENERLQSDLDAMEIKRNTASVNLMKAIEENERLRAEIELVSK